MSLRLVLAFAALAACEPIQTSRSVSVGSDGAAAAVGVDSGPVRTSVGTGGASVGVSEGPVSASVGTGGARVGVDSGPVEAGLGTSGPRASMDVVDTRDLGLKVGVSGSGPSASMRVGDFPVRLKLSPRGLGVSM